MKDKDAKRLLKDKREGTFLVRFSQGQEKYYLNMKKSRSKKSMMTKATNVEEIKEVKIQGMQYFYLKKGFSTTSLLQLMQDKDNRIKYNLLFPVNSDEARSQVPVTIRSEPQTIPEPEPEPVEEDVNIESLLYFHDKLSEEDAEDILTGRPKGFFLVRYLQMLQPSFMLEKGSFIIINLNTWRLDPESENIILSWCFKHPSEQSTTNQVRHSVISSLAEQHRFVLSNAEFSNIPELVTHFMTKPGSQAFNL